MITLTTRSIAQHFFHIRDIEHGYKADPPIEEVAICLKEGTLTNLVQADYQRSWENCLAIAENLEWIEKAVLKGMKLGYLCLNEWEEFFVYAFDPREIKISGDSDITYPDDDEEDFDEEVES